MKTSRVAWGLLLAGVLGVAQSRPLDVGAFTIELPEAFQGLNTQAPMPNTTVLGFTVESAPIPKPVIMIILRENDRPNMRELTPDEASIVCRKLAADMVAGTARRRSEFQASEPRDLRVAGLPAVEVEWTGKLNDIATGGRLFVMLDGSTAYFFHVMGAAPPTQDMRTAVEAVLQLRKKP